MPDPHSLRPSHRRLSLFVVLWLIGAGPTALSAPGPADGGKSGGAALEGPVLVAYVAAYVRDRDLLGFRERVNARFDEGQLLAILRDGDAEARRAAVMALGAAGSFRANARLAAALKDRDPVVRAMTTNALWSIWFRADSPENNERLQEVMALIRREKLRDADAGATRLIDRAPTFAEAYNQRAIIRFAMGRHEESIADCRKVLELNPYHFGAISGLGQCYLRLGKPEEAIEAFRLGLKVQPFNEDLRLTIEALEADR